MGGSRSLPPHPGARRRDRFHPVSPRADATAERGRATAVDGSVAPPRAGHLLADDRAVPAARASCSTSRSSSTRSSRAPATASTTGTGSSRSTDFVGLDNFHRAFSDHLFRDALRHNVILIVLSLVLQIPFALGLALLLNVKLPGRALLRTLFFAPYILSEVVTGVVWRQILRPDGLLDHDLTAVGAEGLIHEWLADPDIVLYSLFFVISWKYFGFHMILLLAGLQQIPKELNEAALDRRRLGVAALPLRDAAAARPDDPGVGLPVDHRRAAAVRPRVGHHQGRPDRRLVDDGDVPLRPVPPEPVRLRQRGVDRDLRALARRRRSSTNASPCGATSKGLVSLARRRVARCASALVRRRRSLVLARDHHPADVLGARRLPHQPATRREPGRPAQPVGARRTTPSILTIGLVLAPGAQQHRDRAADRGDRAARRRRWPRS